MIEPWRQLMVAPLSVVVSGTCVQRAGEVMLRTVQGCLAPRRFVLGRPWEIPFLHSWRM